MQSKFSSKLIPLPVFIFVLFVILFEKYQGVRRFSSMMLSNNGLTKISEKICGTVYLVPMFSDNYGLLLVDEKDTTSSKRIAACIDPGDGLAILKAADALNLDLKYVLCTHKHADHVGGNTVIRQRLPSVQIIGTGYEEIPEINIKVHDGDSISFGGLEIKTIYAPCHTKGHVLYYVQRKEKTTGDSREESPILFSGDTLFVGGCGRFFEGTASDMLANMDRIASLPPDTHVFCAHEYTESNLKFLASIDDGPACSSMLSEVVAKRRANIPTVPSTVGRELEYNLFMKCREARTQELLKCRNAEETMGTLRKRKNDFK